MAYTGRAVGRSLLAHSACFTPVDDRSWLYRPFNQSLFLVDGKTGLTAEMAEELIFRLNRP